MTTVTLTSPVVRPTLFPPPAVPLRFTDGDRYVWTHTMDVWTRTDGLWVPSRYDGLNDGLDDGTGTWTDAEVRAALGRAVERWDARQRFVPAVPPGHILPGRMAVAGPPLHEAAQYVIEHQGSGLLVPLRDLMARYDEDAAYDVPGVVTGSRMRDLASGIVAEHAGPVMTYDEAAGRVYVRYWAGRPAHAECLHVFVFTASPVEA
ncbi:hypothetical protein ACFUJY_29745 [Streptomyces sp. NPDC057249]|uniref:hypothetical protein n=1 Tax=Streptomyces sp. NPDC057249 TaxID=3346067 RepID=UPI0036379EEB